MIQLVMGMYYIAIFIARGSSQLARIFTHRFNFVIIRRYQIIRIGGLRGDRFS